MVLYSLQSECRIKVKVFSHTLNGERESFNHTLKDEITHYRFPERKDNFSKFKDLVNLFVYLLQLLMRLSFLSLTQTLNAS